MISRPIPASPPVVNYTAVGATEAFFSFPCCAAIPIIAVSSFAMKGDEEMARAAGCDHYVTKPYSTIQMLRVIRGFPGEKL